MIRIIEDYSNSIIAANIETADNRQKQINNIGKQTENLESYNNTQFLNMVSKIIVKMDAIGTDRDHCEYCTQCHPETCNCPCHN